MLFSLVAIASVCAVSLMKCLHELYINNIWSAKKWASLGKKGTQGKPTRGENSFPSFIALGIEQSRLTTVGKLTYSVVKMFTDESGARYYELLLSYGVILSLGHKSGE